MIGEGGQRPFWAIYSMRGLAKVLREFSSMNYEYLLEQMTAAHAGRMTLKERGKTGILAGMILRRGSRGVTQNTLFSV